MTCLRAHRVRARRARRLERRRTWQRLHALAISRQRAQHLFADDVVRRGTREPPSTWRARVRWWIVRLRGGADR